MVENVDLPVRVILEREMRLAGFAEWAVRSGGPHERTDRGQWLYELEGEDGPLALEATREPVGGQREVRTPLATTTIEQDLAILRSFVGFLAAENVSRGIRGEETLHPGVEAHLQVAFDLWVAGLTAAGRSPTTLERYLVALRRYARFRGFDGGMRNRSGPFHRRHRTGRQVLTVEDLTAWFETIKESRRVTVMTWLLLAGCDVPDLAGLQYNRQVTRDPERRVSVIRPGKPPLVCSNHLSGLLAGSWPDSTTPLFPAAAHPDRPVGVPALRQTWNRYRDGRSFSMRDFQLLARRARVDRVDGELRIEFLPSASA